MEPIIVTGKEWAKAVLPDPVLRWLQARRQVWFARRTRARDRQVFINHLRADDVFVVGHPKSGNTWVAYMLALLSYPDRQDQVTLSNIEAYIPLIPGESDSRCLTATGRVKAAKQRIDRAACSCPEPVARARATLVL